eukprot:TRINITY_DN37255_c0_g2_i1.p1 TRINITY_DN37255_c0_g2~~TRINITY_DN37255_c0_g2_i1.p1  ORF type:complete len:367 (-),score=29.34 TRINITY_DN37255_c0_g2_i1:216-1316(-)
MRSIVYSHHLRTCHTSNQKLSATEHRVYVCGSKHRVNVVNNVIAFTQTDQQSKQALLLTKFKAHEAALTAVILINETTDNIGFVSTGLDKQLSLWRIEQQNSGSEIELYRSSVQAKGAPIFSLQQDQLRSNGTQQVLFCGTAAKQVVAWEPHSQQFVNKVVLGDHTGWVRSLASNGRWLYSCGCNFIRQWDLTWAVPREVRKIGLYTGDVLALVASNERLVACCADGSLRTWTIQKNGDLTDQVNCERAHDGRVTGAVLFKGLLYTIGFDGVLRAWCPESLKCILDVKCAHDGKRIYCITIGPEGYLYTGGDDQLIRRWSPEVLDPIGNPIHCHSGSVRVMAAGEWGSNFLISGDSTGSIAVWKVA